MYDVRMPEWPTVGIVFSYAAFIHKRRKIIAVTCTGDLFASIYFHVPYIAMKIPDTIERRLRRSKF